MNLREFVDPPKKFRSIPYWSLNNELEPAELESQAREIKRRGFGGFVLHAGDGLKTIYLSDSWTKALKRVIEVANELKIEAWLHDDDRGPSGSAGGTVTAENEEYLPQALTWNPQVGNRDDDILDNAVAYVLTTEDGTRTLVTERPDDLTGVGVFSVRTYEYGHNYFNGDQYADILNPLAVRAFIDTTHNLYKKTFPHEFGEYLPGMVTDGATVNRSIDLLPGDEHRGMSFPWTVGFPAYFHKMHGYSILDNLHHLVDMTPYGFGVRHDFWHAVNGLFIDAFTLQASSWCGEHGMMFGGSISSPGDFRSLILNGGAVMPHYEHMSIPVVDSPGLVIKDIVAVKAAASAAAQFAKKRVMAKVFGSSGYDRSFGELKTTVDSHIALGINTLSPQEVKYSLAGDRKYDNPPTFSYHIPGTDELRAFNDYTARCSWIAQCGRDTASVLVMMPLSGAYGSFDITRENGGDALTSIENSFRAVVDEFVADHIPFHIGDERITGRYGAVSNNKLCIGAGEYDKIVLPPSPSWRQPLVDLLESFTGRIVIMGEVPGLVDGRESDRVSKLAEKDSVTVIPDNPEKAAQTAIPYDERLITVTDADNNEARNIMVNHRIDAGAHVIFLANTDTTQTADITVSLKTLGGVVELDATTGRGFRYRSTIKDGTTRIDTTLAPSGSRIFLIDQTQTSIDTAAVKEQETALTIEGPYKYQPDKENCLVLDRCSLEIDRRQIMKNAPVWKVKRAIWEKTALDEYQNIQPWALKSRNVRSKTNTTTLTFTFTIRNIPETITLGMEHSERFNVTINGAKIDFSPGRWHLDRRMRVLSMEEHVVEGENVIVATTDYLWDTDISPIYITGDFAVGNEAEGYPIISRSDELPTGSWTDHGFPFYAGTMTYILNFNLDKTDGTRYELDLGGFRGTAASVLANDTVVGVIPFPPYRGDITGALVDGENTVEIAVAGSLRNQIGPLHRNDNRNDALFTADSFCDDSQWTDEYRLEPYGLINPPRLIRITPVTGE